MSVKPLTPKQQRFVEEYVIDSNGAQAAIRAGYSEAGAKVRGSELLTNRNVLVALRRAQNARTERTEITQDLVLNGMHREATREGDGSSHGARVTAWGQLGKFTETFRDSPVVAISGDVTVQMVQFDPGKLERK